MSPEVGKALAAIATAAAAYFAGGIGMQTQSTVDGAILVLIEELQECREARGE